MTTTRPELDQEALLISEQALACSDENARRQLIDARCADRPELAARVRHLLALVPDEATTETLPLGPNAGRDSEQRQPPRQRIGPYQIIETLGLGGMGVVYLAERVDGGFEQKVALKLVRTVSPALAERFLLERSILARLSHPYVAHLVDGGLTDSDQPWFALEYVKGERITDWCDQRNLDLHARVELFLKVCDAVQFAHRNLVLHRDIKPANILVATDGTPKLLDFGIAKLLGEADPTVTQTLSLTPAYASPEQRRGDPATTASDVYQLGLVLYELICGVPAHAAASHQIRTSPQADTSVQQPLPRPDAALRSVVARNQAAGTRLARRRGMSIERLLRGLRGDLGRVVANALNPDPVERYDTVLALTQDLQRWQQDLPVRAHRGNVFYRAGKFLRRNPGGSLATFLLVMASGFYLFHVARSNQEIREQRDQSAAIAQFMQELFSAADPRVRSGGEKTARELLAMGSERIAQAPHLSNPVRATLLATIARSNGNLGLYDESRPLYRQALAIYKSSPMTGDTLYQYARTLSDATLADVEGGNTDDTDAHEDDVQDLLGRLGERDGIAYAYALGAAASIEAVRSNYPEAIGYYDRLLALRPALFDQDPRFFCAFLLNSAAILELSLRPTEAIARTREAIACYRLTQGESHPDYARAMASLAGQLSDIKRYGEAEQAYTDGISAMRRGFGDRHRHVAIRLNDFGVMLNLLGRFQDAHAALTEALDIIREVYGEDHLFYRVILIHLAEVEFETNPDGSAVRELYEQATRGDQAIHPIYLPRFLHLQARLACRSGDVDGALALFHQAESPLSEKDRRRARIAWHRARCLIDHGRSAEVSPGLDQITRDLDDVLGEQAWDSRQAHAEAQRTKQAALP